jgi:hypothetical protein
MDKEWIHRGGVVLVGCVVVVVVVGPLVSAQDSFVKGPTWLLFEQLTLKRHLGIGPNYFKVITP